MSAERAHSQAELTLSQFRLDAITLRSRILQISDPFETRAEAELRAELKKLADALDYVAERRKERSHEH